LQTDFQNTQFQHHTRTRYTYFKTCGVIVVLVVCLILPLNLYILWCQDCSILVFLQMNQLVCCSGFTSLSLSSRPAYHSVSTFAPMSIVCYELIEFGKLSETLRQVALFGA